MAVSNTPKKTDFLPPETAVEIAWARTTELSSNEAIRINAERPKQQMSDILEKARGFRSQDPREEKYVESVHSAIEATFRNLATARNSLDLNFKEAKALRTKEIENIEYLEKFSSELQSFIPKASGMTIGGVAGGVLLSGILENWFPPNLKPYAMPLVLALGAACGYLFHGLVVVRTVRKRILDQIISLDYDQIQYYKQYVNRVSAILRGLYKRVERAHEAFLGMKYAPKTMPEDVVKNVLSGMEQNMCKNVAACMINDWVDTKVWSMCETGQDAGKCKYYDRS